MATAKIYHDEEDKEYTVNFVLKSSLLNDGDATSKAYMVITTSISKLDGSSHGQIKVETLSDTPPGEGVAASWTELCREWVKYFSDEAEVGQTSSSSSDSSSSSSDGYSESSSSSS
tara:strand:+ start:75639 stop:75986 length:348 start_codon:yes stop_codon:yes gene_type:complete